MFTDKVSENNHKFVDIIEKKVLILDDDYVRFIYIEDLLRKSKFEIYRAVSIENAKIILNSHSDFSLLIVNTGLIAGNYLKGTIDQLKLINERLPVLALFNESKSLADNTRDLGVDVCISLHVDSGIFLETVNDLMINKKNYQLIS